VPVSYPALSVDSPSHGCFDVTLIDLGDCNSPCHVFHLPKNSGQIYPFSPSPRLSPLAIVVKGAGEWAGEWVLSFYLSPALLKAGVLEPTDPPASA